MRINLKVHYSDKDKVKNLGAKWDRVNKNWYIENMDDLTPFFKWMPDLPKSRKEQKWEEVLRTMK